MKSCRNCNKPLADERFCPQCGQAANTHVLQFRELMGEVMENLFNVESRLWKTFWPLAAKPGYLTNEYINGRRQTYVTPFKLYLVLSVLFFFFSTGEVNIASNTVDGEPVELDQAQIDERQAEILASCQNVLRLPGDFIGITCKNLANNSQSVGEALVDNFPLVMLLGFPLVALLMKVFYLNSGKLYAEHIIFLLHAHAIFFLISLVVQALSFVGQKLPVLDVPTNGCQFVLQLYFVYYMFRAMRAVYGQGFRLTLFKMVFLVTGYLMLGGINLMLGFVWTAYFI